MTPDSPSHFGAPILAVDTCGPSGSVALGRLAGRDLEILGQTELAGRTYSATLVSAVAALLESARVPLNALGGMVAVNGPGSFTGVRVGLSAVKGLAESAQIPVVPLSRLLVLARKAGTPSAALDAQRGELYLRFETAGRDAIEILAGPAELAALSPPVRIAVCDEAAAGLIGMAWPSTQLVRSAPPLAADALRLGESRLVAGVTADLALLDGHYLRRPDAEISAEKGAEIFSALAPAEALARRAPQAETFDPDEIEIRELEEPDLETILGMSELLDTAPRWPAAKWRELLSGRPAARRVALVAAHRRSRAVIGFVLVGLIPPEAEIESMAVMPCAQRRGVGRSLLASLVTCLRASGICALHLEVRASNSAALGFYRAQNFNQTGVRPRYYADPEEDAILMTLRLA